jgi:sugar porter (SP) family MFS transporter
MTPSSSELLDIPRQTLTVEQPRNTAFIVGVSGVAALGGLLFGFDTAVISGAIPAITAYFQLDGYWLGWTVGAVLIGCALGAVFAGRLADKFGRRSLLLVCAFLFALSGAGAGLSHQLMAFILFRMAGGLGVGAAAMISPMYIAETVPAAWRGRLVSLYQLAIVLGILGAYFSNYLLQGLGDNSWRWMFASQAAPSVLFGVLLLFLPESPRWLIGQGRRAAAAVILEKMNGRIAAQKALVEIEQSFSGHKASIKEALAPGYRRVLFMGILIAVFQQVTGINAILYYAPVIFKQTGMDTSSSLLQTISIGVVNVLSACVAIGLVDRLGRKKFMVIGSAVMGLSLITVGLCFYFGYFQHYWVLIFTLLYVAAFGCTLGAVTWVYLSEIFPNRIRGIAMSIATLALWLADFIVTWTFPLMTEQMGTSWTLFCYAVLCVIACVYFIIKMPETKGRSLEEIESLFINKLP